MAALTIHEVSRTKIQVKGDIIDQQELHRVFDETCDGRLASMFISYDKTDDLTTVLLVPIRLTEEFIADNNGEQVNYRTVYKVDKCLMKKVFKDIGGDGETFIHKVWMPFKKNHTKDNVVLPKITETADCYTFELLSCDMRRGSKVATTTFRNRNMREAKYYLVHYFAPFGEQLKASKPAAALLTELSLVMDDVLCDSEKNITPIACS